MSLGPCNWMRLAKYVRIMPITKYKDKYLGKSSEGSYGTLLSSPHDKHFALFVWTLAKDSKIAYHYHDCHEIIRMHEGRVLWLPEGVELKAGDTKFVEAGHRHACIGLEESIYDVIFVPRHLFDILEEEHGRPAEDPEAHAGVDVAVEEQA